MKKLVMVSIVYRGQRFSTLMSGTIGKDGAVSVPAAAYDAWVASCGVKDRTTFSVGA